MWDLSVLGIDVYHLLNWLIIYSFFGWVWETCYVSVKSGKFVNRGFINGPLCTIYGFGAVSVYAILRPVSDNILYLYVGGVVVATALEYVTAVLMESIFHTSWWDYSDNKFNFQGRICLGASLGWGFFTVLLFKVLHPVVETVVALYPVFVGEIGVCDRSRSCYRLCFFSSSSLPYSRETACYRGCNGTGKGRNARQNAREGCQCWICQRGYS